MRTVVAALIAALLALEGAARVSGLGLTLVYEKTAYGYRVAPKQSITRLGKATYYNDLGLRNDTILTLPSERTLRILCIGDSITFGGTLTDQGETFPYQLQQLLARARPEVTVEVLNASAGGWAIENEEGWLNAHGVLGAKWVVLQVATHDLFQAKSGPDIVGSHHSFPDRQPLLALQEAVTRYVLPAMGRWTGDPGAVLYQRSDADVRRALSSIERISMMTKRAGANLVVLHVEQPRSLEPGDALTVWAKRALFRRLSDLEIPLIRAAPAMEQAGGTRLFRDGLHPTAGGNRVIAKSLFDFFSNGVKQSSRIIEPHQNTATDAPQVSNRSSAGVPDGT